MNNRKGLDRLVKLFTKTNGNGDAPLIQKLARNWEMYRRAGETNFALSILIFRTYGDFLQALDQFDDDAPDADTANVRK